MEDTEKTTNGVGRALGGDESAVNAPTDDASNVSGSDGFSADDAELAKAPEPADEGGIEAETEEAESGADVDMANIDANVGDGEDGAQVEEPAVDRGPLEETVDEDEEIKMDWYILKVQSNRENTICDALRRRIAVVGLDAYFGDILVPTEDIAEFKNGKKKIVRRKLYPGYIVVHMSINDDTWFLVRETSGIGDFTGSQGRPSPMLKHEVDRIVKTANPDEEDGEQIKTSIPFKTGDRVRIKEGTFENFEGDVDGIDEANGRVTVMINIFGRSTPFEAEHWQIESV